jgi:hypothetical protein
MLNPNHIHTMTAQLSILTSRLAAIDRRRAQVEAHLATKISDVQRAELESEMSALLANRRIVENQIADDNSAASRNAVFANATSSDERSRNASHFCVNPQTIATQWVITGKRQSGNVKS